MKKRFLPILFLLSFTLVGCEAGNLAPSTTPVAEETTVESTTGGVEGPEEVVEEPVATKNLNDIVSDAAKSTGLQIEVSNSPIWDIVQIYGNSEDDFAKMKEAFISISLEIDPSIDESELSSLFDEKIGTEDGVDAPGLLERAIFSAPNEDESWYRVDIYTKAFLEEE